MSRQKPAQVLEMDPQHELSFVGPFTDVVTSTLKLTNPSDRRVCFKVKTTAPRRYCVRPNSDFLEPSASVNVSVMLQPVESDSQDKGRHKFMVQSMYAPEKVDDVEALWSNASSSDLMDSKLRCVFIEGGEKPVVQATQEVQESTNDGVSSTSGNGETEKSELKSIMEEFKRLQGENAKLKQLNDELKNTSGTKGGSGNIQSMEMAAQQKKQFTLFILIGFVLGVLFGYILL